jgi:hypothetical protein
VGWLDASGNVVVAAYDGAGRRARTAMVHRDLGADDHNNPVLLVEPDGRLTVFYSRHDGRSGLMYRRTERPGDIGAWGAERRMPGAGPRRGWAYPNPQHLAAERRTFLFWRGLQWDPTFATRRDGGRWSRPRMLLRVPGQSAVERPYIKFDGDGRGRIDFAFTPSHPSKYPTSIYYARYRHGMFSRADGTRIAGMQDLPLLPRQVDTIYDASKTRVRAWVYDVAADRRGRPVIVYALIRGPHDHRYVYAAWNGRRWVTHTIVAAGGTIVRTGTQPFYSGGISLDHSDPRVAYLSRPVGPTSRDRALDDSRPGGHMDPPAHHRSLHRRQPAPRRASGGTPTVACGSSGCRVTTGITCTTARVSPSRRVAAKCRAANRRSA